MGRPPIKVYENLWDILKEIESFVGGEDRIIIYRGHTSFRHKLRPGIFRSINEKIKNNERDVLRELMTRHPKEFESDIGVFEKLVRMQHYGLPTRLLDVTYNPLVAVYFACEHPSEVDAELIIMGVDKNYFKYFDSDTVRCISNLSNLRNQEIRYIKERATAESLNGCPAGVRLCDFVMQERPNFKPEIKIEHLKDFYLVAPRLSNPRIQAQNGAFIIFGLEEEINSQTRGFRINRIRIKKERVNEIKRSVELLGFTESTIYPELSRTSEVIKRKYGIAK